MRESHNRTVLSLPAEAISVTGAAWSVDVATATQRISNRWPDKMAVEVAVEGSQSFIKPSLADVAMVEDGESAATEVKGCVECAALMAKSVPKDGLRRWRVRTPREVAV